MLELSRSDSVTTTLLSGGSAPGPRLSRSMSRDTGLDAGGGSEAVLLRRQVELLQEEVTRLRLKGEEPSREKKEQGRKLSNGSVGDIVKSEKVSQSVRSGFDSHMNSFFFFFFDSLQSDPWLIGMSSTAGWAEAWEQRAGAPSSRPIGHPGSH